LEEQEMKKIPKQAYTTEFKEQAVKRVADGQAIVSAAKELGLTAWGVRREKAVLFQWV
jgi:transposase